MKKIIIIIPVAFLIAVSCFAQNHADTISAEIEKVTVFLSGAEVYRTARVNIFKGKNTIVVNGISPYIEKQSIQVKTDNDIVILSVNHAINYLNEAQKRASIMELDENKIRLNKKLQKAKAMLEVYQKEEDMLLSNKAIGGENDGVKIEELKSGVHFFRDRLTEIKMAQLLIKQNMVGYGDSIAKIGKQLTELNSQKDEGTSEITIAISARQKVAAKLEISYLIRKASWFPTYDIRVKKISSPVQLFYKANVSQNSGEDWNDVKLIIATGNPSKSGSKPVLTPWKLSFNTVNINYSTARSTSRSTNVNTVSGYVFDAQGIPIPGANIVVKGTTYGTISDWQGRYTLELPANASTLNCSFIGYQNQEYPVTSSNINFHLTEDNQALDEVVVVGYGQEASQDMSSSFSTIHSDDMKIRGISAPSGGASRRARPKQKQSNSAPKVVVRQAPTHAKFDIENPYTIPSDGKKYTVDMAEYEIPASYHYHTVPKYDAIAFLTARITDWEQLNLLSGEGNLFFEGVFMGKSFIDAENTQDTMILSLGRDESIAIEREKQKEYTKVQHLGGNRKETIGWEISLRNKKSEEIEITVEDQFPVSVMREIDVDVIDHTPGEYNEETGIIKWRLKLQPQETKKLELKYSVKYPKDHRLQLE